MTVRIIALAAPLLLSLTLAAPAQAADPAPPAPASAPAPANLVRVALTTDAGVIELDLDAARAPVTTANFLRYVQQRRFDGTVFYRVMRLAWGEQPNGLIQAGTRGDPRKTLPGIKHEPTNETGVLHKAGAISMARFAPGTAAGDFSILLSDMPGLDAEAGSADPERRAGFAAFGHVASGMDVVRKIYDAPLSATLGEGVMKGQMIEKPIRILSARRVAIPAATAPTP